MVKSKMTFFYAIIICFCVNTALLKATWTEKELTGYSNLNAIDFVNDNVGWIVGNNGIILKTTNGGVEWIPQNSNVTYDILDVDFIDENIGCAVCRNECLTTSDGGQTWTSQYLTYHWLGTIKFGDKQHAWITGEYGQIMFSSDAGRTWSIQKEMGLQDDYFDISSPSPNVAYMVGQSPAFKTVNGGQTWTQLQESGIGKRVCFVNENTGWISEGFSIAKTTDGGDTWNHSVLKEYSSDTEKEFIDDVYFTDINNGWAVTTKYLQTIIYKTQDGGNSWTPEKKLEGSIYLKLICIPNKNTCYFLGYDYLVKFSNDTQSTLPEITTNTTNNSIDYGVIQPALPSSRTIKLNNSGASNLNISNIEITADDRSLFRIKNLPTMPIVLTESQSLTLDIEFSNPNQNEIYNSNLKINSNSNTNSELVIALHTKTSSSSNVEDENINNIFDKIPNPISKNTRIEIPKDKNSEFNVFIEDILGNRIQDVFNSSLNVSNEGEIDISSLPSGTYLLIFQNDKSVYTKKIIIQK